MENKYISKALIPFRKPLISFDRIIIYLKKLLNKKYFVSKTLYEKFLIKNIIFDERNKIVSTFKENLIWNDTSEFIKKFYNKKDSILRLNKYYEFYNKYSKLFPNYIPLCESKYIYKNIHKKQKMLDLQQNQINYIYKDIYKTRNNLKSNKIFSSEVYHSIEDNSKNINSIIFGIHKIDVINNNSINDISNLVNSIEKIELDLENDFQQPKHRGFRNILKDLKNKNIIINNYYYNNSSILTKQNAIPSILAQQQQKNYVNEKMFSILKNNMFIGLKKNKKKFNFKSVYNKNSVTFKNLISFGLININNEKKNKIKRHIIEDTYSFTNSTKNNKSVSNTKSSKYINNKNCSINSKRNNNRSNNKTNNNINYNKDIPNTSRGYVSYENKLIDDMNKLNNIINNKKYKKIVSKNYKTNIKSPNICINNKKKKKINFSVINKNFFKTNYLTHRTFNYIKQIINSIKFKHHQLSVNIKLRKFSKNATRNNSDIKSSKRFFKINKNSNILLKKMDNNKSNRLNDSRKKTNFKNLTKTFNSHITSKTLKIKNNNSNINTDKEYLYKNKFNEDTIKKIIRNKQFKDKIENLKYKNISDKIDKTKINDYIKLINESDFTIKSFLKNEKENYTINYKINFKNNKCIDTYQINRLIFKKYIN